MQGEEWASKNLKDRYFSLIERLVEEEIADKCTIPFVPYRGSAYGDDNRPKILVIGKATYGWGKREKEQGSGALNAVLGRDDLWEHLSKLSEEFIEGQIIPFYGGEKGLYHSQFWNRIYRLTGQCLYGYSASKSEYKRERQRSEKCFRSIAWSNVFKVGALKSEGGNPKKKLRDIQKEENTLKEEINELQPDVAIFSTGPDEYDKHIKDLLPNTSMEDVGPEHEHLKIKEIECLDTLAFRTYHFQSYSNEEFEQVVDYICGRMNGTVTEG
jgi:hypothetical protein